ncbi:iron-sulfur cluster biosynthesis family protein [Schleiferilactobacillus shenzhenensis]|uniref:Core domain-containing protein n=1 Tax=Schleiferilactobacillus shenzhenensis LY-73 TaxID=1231336 RepID=U4TJX9_9LACO|nr:iron-sulfur cluster biosynthesis family protein [Schleiferilactobacillus shenzhenensis]ERL65151.1 hypothetical protein L248_3089 [Schleiferilactobacillus shenzhenensis LY-73]
MTEINITDPMAKLLAGPRFAGKTLLLITDDGGGKYSLQGGACSIGTKFTLIILDQPDPDYSIPLTNNAGVPLFTSQYDLTFLGQGLTMDYQHYSISLRDDTGLLDGGVLIAKGADVLAAFKQGIFAAGATC